MKVFLVTSCIFVVIIFIGNFICKQKNIKQPSFMSKEFTNQLKGYSIMAVIWAHIGKGLGVDNLQFIAAIGVGIFLLCSGYGLTSSYYQNGMKQYWVKRIARVFIPYWVIRLLFYLLEIRQISGLFRFVFLSEYNWFVEFICLCYILFGLCFTLPVIRDNRKIRERVLLFLFMGLFLEISIFPPSVEIPFLQARQVLCFPLGVWLGQRDNKEKSIIWLRNKNNVWEIGLIAVLFVAGLFFMYLTRLQIVVQSHFLISNFIYLVANTVFVIMFLLVIVLFPYIFKSVTVQYIGKVSYELMIVHFFYVFQISDLQDISVFFLKLVIGTIIAYCLDSYLIRLLKNERKKG